MGWVGRLSGASASLLPRKSGAGEDEERFGGVGDGCSDAWRESGGKAVASTRYTNLSYLSACRFRVRVRFGFRFGFGFALGGTLTNLNQRGRIPDARERQTHPKP